MTEQLSENIDVKEPSCFGGEIPPDMADKVGSWALPRADVKEIYGAILVGPYALGYDMNNTPITATTLHRNDVFSQTLTLTTVNPSKIVAGHRVERALSLMNIWAGNYFHWLLEGLTSLMVVEEKGLDNFTIIAPPSSGEVLTYIAESLDILGYWPLRYRAWDGRPLGVTKLLITDPVRWEGLTSPWAAKRLRERVLKVLYDEKEIKKLAHPDRMPKRIYITRRGARTRRVVNDSEVIAHLARYGFIAVSLDDTPVWAQAHLFDNAEMVIAPHGAGLTNMVWSEHLTVLEMFGSYINPCYFMLARCLGHRYACLLAEPQGDDLIISLEVIDAALGGNNGKAKEPAQGKVLKVRAG